MRDYISLFSLWEQKKREIAILFFLCYFFKGIKDITKGSCAHKLYLQLKMFFSVNKNLIND